LIYRGYYECQRWSGLAPVFLGQRGFAGDEAAVGDEAAAVEDDVADADADGAVVVGVHGHVVAVGADVADAECAGVGDVAAATAAVVDGDAAAVVGGDVPKDLGAGAEVEAVQRKDKGFREDFVEDETGAEDVQDGTEVACTVADIRHSQGGSGQRLGDDAFDCEAGDRGGQALFGEMDLSEVAVTTDMRHIEGDRRLAVD
jgi:hypothetical protein